MKTRIRKGLPVPNMECTKQAGYFEYFNEGEKPIQVSHCPYNPEDLIKLCESQCASYRKCADWAMKHSWENFTCLHCPNYYQIKNKQEDKAWRLG